jgi:RHS repeat-associated protein
MHSPLLQLLALLLTLWGTNSSTDKAEIAAGSTHCCTLTQYPGLPVTTNYDDKDLFQLELYRNAQATGIPTATFPARNNGDIVAVSSQVRGRSQQVWAVAYDSYDRMTNTAFYQRASRTSTPSLYANYRESLTYDQRGNIKSLQRDGTEQTGANYSKRDFDRLTYIYDNEANNNISNRLLDVNENTGGSTTLGYKPGVANYTYDTNGNLRTDPSKGITVIYNHQDLPTTIVWANGQRLNMTYDAAGTLLRRETRSAANTSLETTDFVGGIEYQQSGTGAKSLATIHHAEGRIVFTGTAQEWQYALADHLGNTRLLYADRHGATTVLPPDGIISVPSEIVQEEHYYPFGMKLTGPWMGGAAGAKSAYQYNGIDHVDAFELNVNMAFYRTLDPVLGRWWSVDPKAEAVKSHSPYVSMGNSPMLNSDPKGDIFGPVLALGLQSMLVSGARSSSQGESFIGGALQGGAIFAANSIASAGIGGIFQGVGGFGKEALRAGVHGLSGGTFSVLQGGSFGSGFAAAALSSGFGSALHGASSGLQIFAGGIAGGIGSVLAGGNFIEGFFQGAIVTGMNHIQHQSLAGDPPKVIDAKARPDGSMILYYDDGTTTFLPAQGTIHSTPAPWEYLMGAGLFKTGTSAASATASGTSSQLVRAGFQTPRWWRKFVFSSARTGNGGRVVTLFNKFKYVGYRQSTHGAKHGYTRSIKISSGGNWKHWFDW